ncbi:LOW QUALITY PROTEIN: cell division protein FtsY [Populus alba x Populus x berolinensis]|nr:LOW QUALITY PROTEIN: cell division protein FtsY [Populus alba x Populus x berolinensis]
MNKFGFSIWSCYGLRCVVRKPAVVMIAGVDGGGKTTSLGLHTNYSLMDELIACKKAAGKIVRGAPDVVGIPGFILTKLDGSARGGYVSVDDEPGIPFVGVGEGVEDLQPFDAEAFVNAIFSTRRSCRR